PARSLVGPPTPHAAPSGGRGARLENRVDKRGQRFDCRRQNEHQTEQAEKDGQGDQPPFTRLLAPQAVCQVGNRAAGGPEHDQPAPETASLLDHAISSSSSSLSSLAVDAARLVTRVAPATSISIPQRRNVEYPSRARLTIGSPPPIKGVF